MRNHPHVHWQQRFSNYKKALTQLTPRNAPYLPIWCNALHLLHPTSYIPCHLNCPGKPDGFLESTSCNLRRGNNQRALCRMCLTSLSGAMRCAYYTLQAALQTI